MKEREKKNQCVSSFLTERRVNRFENMDNYSFVLTHLPTLLPCCIVILLYRIKANFSSTQHNSFA